ncbi:hypothetical protein ACG04R_26205 [Roseateles sp. BYS78W]|uniref:HEPN AbiU2-like domain-containing protein n=1 Tax=Pelomonas candidula TaxID=3299025 RepID=A0ABW7HL51_9BURK
MSSSVQASVIYRTLMMDAKIRVLTAQSLLGGATAWDSLPALKVEFCYLLVRRVIEAVTHGALLREQHRYKALKNVEAAESGRSHQGAQGWETAPEILKRLVQVSPHALPIPIKAPQSVGDVGVYHFDRLQLSVNHGRLIELYKKSCNFLHAKSPLKGDFVAEVDAQRLAYDQAPNDLAKGVEFLRSLLWKHAAITLADQAADDPRLPTSPQLAWILDFGNEAGHEITLIEARAEPEPTN